MIPVASTTVRIERRSQPVAGQPVEADQDPWDTGYPDEPGETVYTPHVSGVRAVISVGGGNYAGRTVGPGDSEVVNYTLLADPVDLGYLDQVVDEVTGDRYSVEWSITSPGIAGMLGSTRAGLSTRKGA